MYNGPPQQFPPQHGGPGTPGQAPRAQEPGGPPPGTRPPASGPVPGRRGTGRVIAITAAVTLAVYGLVVGGVWAVTSSSGSHHAGPSLEGLDLDPCAAPGSSDLRSLNAVLASASYSEAGTACWWVTEFANGSPGSLRVTYSVPANEEGERTHDASDTASRFAEERGKLIDGTDGPRGIEILEGRDLDLGDESFVSHYLAGTDGQGSNATVLVRKAEYLVEIRVLETGEDRSGRVDFTVGEEVIISIAERALSRLG